VKLLAIGRLRPGLDARESVAPLARDELRTLWELYGEGVVREMYSPGGPGAILVLEADSLQHAEAELSKLPLVVNGVFDFELVELRPLSAIQMLFS
jgi:hypothetical protein